MKNTNLEGYWYNRRDGKLYLLEPEEEHVLYLLDHWQEFGIRPFEIELWEDKWDTTLEEEYRNYMELGDREYELCLLAMRRGALRIRFYSDQDGEVNETTFCSIDYWRKLDNVAGCLIENKEEFEGWPIYAHEVASGNGEDFRNANELIKAAYL